MKDAAHYEFHSRKSRGHCEICKKTQSCADCHCPSEKPTEQDGQRVALDKPSQVIMLMVSMTELERARVLEAMGDYFCRDCGSDNPRCQCWNSD